MVLTYNNSTVDVYRKITFLNLQKKGYLGEERKIKIPHELQNKQINWCCNKIILNMTIQVDVSSC